MKPITILTSLILLFSCSVVNAQTYSSQNNIAGFENVVSKATQLSLFNAQSQNLRNSQNQSVSKKVFVQQIGNNNVANAVIQSLSSDVNSIQLGSENEIGLVLKAARVNNTVVQRGFNNSFVGLSVANQLVHRGSAIQQGRNQNLIWLGSNSISEKMTIRMSGKNQTVLVRNIKR